MGWATFFIQKLQEGETVQFRPRGNSMVPKIRSGQLCTVAPIEDWPALSRGDIVLCRVAGREYLHLVSARQGDRFQISNNKGHINGWIGPGQIFGRLIGVEQ